MFHSIESIDNKLYNIFSTGSNDRTENSGHPCNHPASIFFMVDPPCLSCMIAFWSWSILHFLMLNPSGWIKVIHQPENHRHKAILEWFPPYKHIPKEYVTREVLIKFIHIFSKYYCWYPFISHKSQIISHWHPYIKPLLNPYSHFYHPIKSHPFHSRPLISIDPIEATGPTSVSYAKPIPQHLQASIRKPSMRSRKLRDLDVHRDVRAEEADGGSHATQSARPNNWRIYAKNPPVWIGMKFIKWWFSWISLGSSHHFRTHLLLVYHKYGHKSGWTQKEQRKLSWKVCTIAPT